MIKLRPYQTLAKESILKSFKDYNSVLLPLPTRTGKTEVAIAVAKEFDKVCFVAHLEQLVNNLSNRLSKNNIGNFVLQANTPSLRSKFTVASRDTLINRLEYKNFLSSLELVIFDEAHNGVDSIKIIKEHCPNAKFLMLTATPYRADGRGLGEICDFIVPCLTESEAVKEGWKVKTEYIIPQKSVCPAHLYRVHANGEKAIVFCEDIKHANTVLCRFTKKTILGKFTEDTIKATVIHSNLSQDVISERLKGFERGEYDVMVNVNMLTIGYDLPTISCIIIDRKVSKSLALWRQMARGSGVNCDVNFPTKEQRLEAIENSTKPSCLCIDINGWVLEHGAWEMTISHSLEGLEKKEVKRNYVICPKCANVTILRKGACSECNALVDFDWQSKERKEKIYKYADNSIIDRISHKELDYLVSLRPHEQVFYTLLLKVKYLKIGNIDEIFWKDFDKLPIYKVRALSEMANQDNFKKFLLQYVRSVNSNRTKKSVSERWIFPMLQRTKDAKNYLLETKQKVKCSS